MKLYCITLEDFINKESYLIQNRSVAKYTAIETMLEYINNYIDSKEGISDIARKIYREPSSTNSRTFSNYPAGYLITRNNSGNLDKFTIYQKKLEKGYVYNYFITKKIFTIQLISVICDLDEEYKENESFDMYDDYENVLVQIESGTHTLKKVNPNKEEE